MVSTCYCLHVDIDMHTPNEGTTHVRTQKRMRTPKTQQKGNVIHVLSSKNFIFLSVIQQTTKSHSN